MGYGTAGWGRHDQSLSSAAPTHGDHENMFMMSSDASSCRLDKWEGIQIVVFSPLSSGDCMSL